MKRKIKFYSYVGPLVACLTLVCFCVIDGSAQQVPETAGERGSASSGFDSVDASNIISKRRPGTSAHKRRYRTGRDFPIGDPAKGKTFVTVGVTLGRGRLATEAEIANDLLAKVKGCVQWAETKCVSRKEMVLARISDDSGVSDKEQIQLAIEYLAYLDPSGNRQSSRIAYLYVINREQSADGAYSKPKLIFPTLNTYDGDNRVMPGKTVVMPDPERPWTISRSEAGTVQAFETYLIIVSPQPLKDISGQELQFEAKPIMLDEKLVASWIRLWGGNESRGDLEKGAGQLITQREVKSSGALNSRKRGTHDDVDDLNQDDPPPQVIFRKIVSPGGKLLVTIKLPYRAAAATATPTP